MLQTVESHSQFLTETRKKSPVAPAANYLYLRGNIFYFRYALPKPMKEHYGKSEVRLSLRTGFLHQARKYARHLHTCLEDLLMADNKRTWFELRQMIQKNFEEKLNEMPNPKAVFCGGDPPDLEHPENMALFKLMKSEEQEYKPLPELYKELEEKIDRLYPQQKAKLPVSIAEIRIRMERLLQQKMDERDSELYDIAKEFFIDNEKKGIHAISDKLWLDHERVVILNPITNDPDKIARRYFPHALVELVDRRLFIPEEFTIDSIIIILNEYHKVMLTINSISMRRACGDYVYEKQIMPLRYNESNNRKQQSSNSISCKEQLLLSNFINKFIETKIADGDWTKRNVPTHKDRIGTLLDILGDIPVADIDRQKMRDFRDILVRLPPNRKKSKEYKDKTIEEILKSDVKIKLNISTVNTILETLSGMFEWGIREELIDKNPAKDLTLKDDRQDIDKKDSLTDQDIKTLFFSGDYTHQNFKNPAYYWVPLISLYTGMRLEEICQLHVEDIYEEDHTWIFDIKTESSDGLNDKILKTKNATRKIPIHPDLIKLGLLDYHKKVAKSSIRLFPELNKTDNSPKYGKQPGKQFSAWLKKKGIDGKKSFHSLRHTFSDYFKKMNLHNDIFRQVFGHEADKLAARQYGSKFSPKQCYDELISKISWNKKD